MLWSSTIAAERPTPTTRFGWCGSDSHPKRSTPSLRFSDRSKARATRIARRLISRSEMPLYGARLLFKLQRGLEIRTADQRTQCGDEIGGLVKRMVAL